MSVFIGENFLLDTREGIRLYREFAEQQPIFDYHSHLPPDEIARDKRWENLAQVWLGGDHYKWRAMRADGVPERFLTGNADDREKFDRYADTMPRLLGNPLYHWSHLELARYFGIKNRLLSPKTAPTIWRDANAVLREGLSARAILKKSRVLAVCSTDDPADSLEHHSATDFKLLPTWRPDRALGIEDPEGFSAYLDRLGEAADVSIASLDGLFEALSRRQDFFHKKGCRLSDHGLELCWSEDCSRKDAAAIFAKSRSGKKVSCEEAAKFKSFLMFEFARMDARRNWTQQLHLGALRTANSRMTKAVGRDTGFDSIGDFAQGASLARFLDRLDSEGLLPRTILYNLNPRDNELFAAMAGNFQDGATPGKIQWGSAWWFLDQKDGIEKQIEALSLFGLLSRFVGMVTDSRSFLSFARHEYFRRVLCAHLGRGMKQGLLPRDFSLVGDLVEAVCFRNAKEYFGVALGAR